ncbi:MAG: ketoacyl-ACP synthase III [Bryobacterales bacterium]|nr:ketoacyl-ACP synthase III [Bryobacterales bacterium]
MPHGTRVYVVGSGSKLPARQVGNAELSPRLGLSPEQIEKSSGIRSRRWAAEDETTSGLGAAALEVAMRDAGVDAGQVDYLIFGTMTPDVQIPGTAPAVQNLLGLGAIPCLDIRAACCNALYGLQVGCALIGSGVAGCVALCLAEVQSAWLNLTPEDGTLSMLFGDGASALILSGESRPGALKVLDVVLATDGQYADDLGVRAPGTRFGNGPGDRLPRMNGRTVILHASRKMTAACHELLARNRLQPSDIHWLAPHQANLNLMEGLARALGLSPERLVSIIQTTGNTSSASMGLALDHLRRSGRLQAGERILLPAFAAGFTWGAGLLTVE